MNGYVVLLLAGKQQQQQQQEQQEQQEHEERLPSPMEPLLLDGYDGGNSASMINDYRANPFHDPHTSEALAAQATTVGGAPPPPPPPLGTDKGGGARSERSGPNVRFCRVFDRGWPYLFIVSLRELCAAEELLLDYSEGYWESRRSAGLGPNQTVPLATAG